MRVIQPLKYDQDLESLSQPLLYVVEGLTFKSVGNTIHGFNYLSLLCTHTHTHTILHVPIVYEHIAVIVLYMKGYTHSRQSLSSCL